MYDKAAIIFSENFYELVFKECLTVCEAFKRAKRMVKLHIDPNIQREAVKFEILTQQNHDKNYCTTLGPF